MDTVRTAYEVVTLTTEEAGRRYTARIDGARVDIHMVTAENSAAILVSVADLAALGHFLIEVSEDPSISAPTPAPAPAPDETEEGNSE